MPKDILDIVDTAVKIGFGAAISGATTYIVTRFNHYKSLEKENLLRRREILENTVEQIETFCNSALQYWAYMIEYIRRKEKDSSDQMLEKLEEQRKETWKIIISNYKLLANAEAKLLLLSYTDSHKLIRVFGEYGNSFFRKKWDYITKEEATNYLYFVTLKHNITS